MPETAKVIRNQTSHGDICTAKLFSQQCHHYTSVFNFFQTAINKLTLKQCKSSMQLQSYDHIALYYYYYYYIVSKYNIIIIRILTTASNAVLHLPDLCSNICPQSPGTAC